MEDMWRKSSSNVHFRRYERPQEVNCTLLEIFEPDPGKERSLGSIAFKISQPLLPTSELVSGNGASRLFIRSTILSVYLPS